VTGKSYAWGRNGDGQLGDGTIVNKTAPSQVYGLSGVVAVAAGETHSLALKSDGTVWAWGANNHGQLGDGSNFMSIIAIQVSSLSNVIAIAAGSQYSLALRSDGTAWAWGYNNYGQLGNGSNTNSNVPVKVSNLSNITAIAAGNTHSLALKSDRTVVGWGDNTFACEATPPACVSSPVAISAGLVHSLVMQQNSCIQSGCPVTNTAPVVTITGPASGSIFAANTPVNFTGTFTDDAGDTHELNIAFVPDALAIVVPGPGDRGPRDRGIS
jgi:alpha-tubulin suppressor-like RCC1 family protein